MLAGFSGTARLVEMFASTVIRVHALGSGRKRGQASQALGRSRGGFGTNMHLKTDHDGLRIVFELTGGQASDSLIFAALMNAGPDEAPHAGVCDKGYDSDDNWAMARDRGAIAVIPYRKNRKTIPIRFAQALYRGCNCIEQLIGKLKCFALRCKKTARNS